MRTTIVDRLTPKGKSPLMTANARVESPCETPLAPPWRIGTVQVASPSVSGPAPALRHQMAEETMPIWKMGAAAAAFALTLVGTPALADDIPMSELPDQVRQTVERETANGEILDVERDDDGETVYEIEFRENNQKFE